MAKEILRLGDPRIDWMFQKGDRVARRRPDGSPDPHERGVIDDASLELERNWSDFENQYTVLIEGGSMRFDAPESQLLKLE